MPEAPAEQAPLYGPLHPQGRACPAAMCREPQRSKLRSTGTGSCGVARGRDRLEYGAFHPPGAPVQLSDIRAIVTGGVSGLGLAVAEHLVAAGGRVGLFEVNDDKGAAAVAALGESKARYLRTDVADEDGVAASVDAAREFLGGLDAAVNCAGIIGAGRVLGREGPMPLSKFSTTVMVNL